MTKKNLESKIMKLDCTFTNFIMSVASNDESKKISDMIISYHNNSDSKHSGMCYINDNACIDKNIKDSTDVLFSNKDNLYNIFMKYLQKSVDEYVKNYAYAGDTTPWAVLDSVKIQHYQPKGGYFDWHCERNTHTHPISSRHLVFMMYLNDVSDGGETEFFYQKLKVSSEKGKLLIWPADWTHTHRGITSDTQEKYIITGWFNFYEK